jgi:hypothetical protein
MLLNCVFTVFSNASDEQKAIVIQKLDGNIALVGYPVLKNEYGMEEWGKIYYVKDNLLRNYADDDEIIGYIVEKILNETYSYPNRNGTTRTVSKGKLIKK